ncbi:MAG: hypothetical protein JWP11_1753 [Frankiales bacterium]|nr:hypothetical protein [Frankiales bacterium]
MSSDSAMPGSHAANQSKTESMPPTEGHADPDAAPDPTTVQTPDLEGMNAGAGDPQAARVDGAEGTPDSSGAPGEAWGVPVTSGDAAPGSSQDSPVVQGLHTPT